MPIYQKFPAALRAANFEKCHEIYWILCISGNLKKLLAAPGRPHLVGPIFEGVVWHQSREVPIYDLN